MMKIEPNGRAAFDPHAVERPDSSLLRYYAIMSLFTLLGFPFVFLYHYFKFLTLRYRFDDEGISVSWGILFRREINLTYRRIQDIHVTRNIIQRWMNLATVSIQTASGSSTPEAQIEGILEYEALRDFLYQQMRGARGLDVEVKADAQVAQQTAGAEEDALVLLREIRDAMKRLTAAREGGS